MNKLEFYLSAPVFFQNLLLNIEGYRIKRRRYNNDFEKFLIFFCNSDHNRVDSSALQSFMLNTNKTDYWKNKFLKYGVDPTAPRNQLIYEIKKLPILSKEEAKVHMSEIINNKLSHKTKSVSTSGTTGSGITFPQTIEMENKQWAVWWRYRKWHGIKLDTWVGWFGGRSIAHINQKKPPFWKINYPMKQVMFSAHHLNENTASFYYKEISEKKLSWLHGYPSQLSFLANLFKSKNYPKLTSVKIITVGAENLLVSQKKIIEGVFGAPVRQHYGLAEGVANISENIDGQLEPDQDFCFVEFIPINPEKPEVCKIVGTNYSNKAFPLIRYDTGDVANVRWKGDGRVDVLSIDGRQEDFITLNNGVKLGRLDHIFKNLSEVKEAQIYQPNTNEVIIRVVKSVNYDNLNQEKLLLKEVKKRIGNDMSLKIIYMSKIPRTKSGKLRFVISEI